MQKIKTFFQTFRSSAFKPLYYKDVLKAPFSFSIKYFLFLFLVLSLLTAATLSFFLVQKVAPYLNQLKTQAPEFYPPDLELTIKDGSVSINQPEPYFIPIKKEWFPEEMQKEIKIAPIDNVLVIDTQVEPSEIKKYQTFVLLTKNDLAFMGDTNEIRIQSLEQVDDFTLNQEVVKQSWQYITPYFKYIIPIMIAFLLIFIPLGTILVKFIYLLMVSVLTWMLSRLFRPRDGRINYSKSLQINLHAITLPTVIIALFQFLGVNPQIPFFQTIILLIFNAIIFSSIKGKCETIPSHSEPGSG